MDGTALLLRRDAASCTATAIVEYGLNNSVSGTR